MRITCQNCKEEVDVAMYFYNQLIATEEIFLTQTREYEARVRGKAICPCCGSEINETFSSIIPYSKIIELATGKETNK